MGRKILVTPRSFGKTSNEPFELLKSNNCEIIRNDSGKQYSEEELLEIVEDVEGIIVGLDPITEKVLSKAKKLKVVSKYGVGLDNIDLEAAERLGVKVTFTPGANNESVADFAFASMMSLSRNIIKLDSYVRNDNFSKIIGTEIFGKTLGVIGTGAIGKGVLRRARGFNMRLIGYDLYPDAAFAKEVGLEYVDKDTLMRESDFISLHVPLTKEMHHFIGKKELEMMKKTSYLINTSRGGVVNEEDLYEALKNGVIAGAALDVFEQEPPKESKLLELDNIILSPHCGASTVDATNRMGLMAVEGLLSVLNQEEPKYLCKQLQRA